MPNDLAPRERLAHVLAQRTVDRPPVFSLGGMMNGALVDIMERTSNPLPHAYQSAETIARLATDISQHTGFEAIAVPFCMTIEAEFLGSDIDLGTLGCEAKIRAEAVPSVTELRMPILRQFPLIRARIAW
jgi:[methyl-Co(III) methanol-specific corrinoid protein]:coenzyme M methyltransferase